MGQGRLQLKYCTIIRFSSKMAELSQEELAAALRSVYEAEGLSDLDVLIAIDEGVLIVPVEATAALVAALAVERRRYLRRHRKMCEVSPTRAAMMKTRKR